MKENKYDDDEFFVQYSRFPRSVDGLSLAGEWHEFRKLLPNFQGKKVLDIGCGFGWHCLHAAENGAAEVVGIDISEKMLKVANQKNEFSNVSYRQIAMEDMEFADDSFDVVISSLAFHYTPSFEDICDRISGFLKPGGEFVFSVEHPVYTACGTQDWIYSDNGEPAHWPVDDYFVEGERDAFFLGEHIIKYHKTLTSYLQTLLNTGFEITAVVEPKPEDRLLKAVTDMKDELRRPMMLLVSSMLKYF